MPAKPKLKVEAVKPISSSAGRELSARGPWSLERAALLLPQTHARVRASRFFFATTDRPKRSRQKSEIKTAKRNRTQLACRGFIRNRSRTEYHATKRKISKSSISAFGLCCDILLHRSLFGFSTAATDKQKRSGKPNPNRLERWNRKTCYHHHI